MMWSSKRSRELGWDDVTNCRVDRDVLCVVEGNVGGHCRGEALGECCDLMMDVGEKGVRAPAAKYLDGLGIVSIEVKGCGPTSSEGMARDAGWWDTLTIQVKGCGCFA